VVALTPGKIDHNVVRAASRRGFGRLMRGGVEIYEYQAALLHAKTMVVDGFASVVGSTNLDFRSFRFNAECNLVVLDEGTGASMEAAFEEDLTRSELIRTESWRRRGLGHRWGDALARRLSPLL
jgi:cardiolipin synthase